MPKLPAITGKQLIKLLQKDGWQTGRTAKHGIALTKRTSSRTLVTFIPNSKAILPDGTLQAILGQKQTKLGKTGLLTLINKYGIK